MEETVSEKTLYGHVVLTNYILTNYIKNIKNALLLFR